MSFLVSFSSVNCCIIPLAGTAALSPLSNFWRSGWKFSSGCFQALTQMILQNSSLFIFLDILLILRSWVDLSFACGVLHSWSLLAEEGDGCYEAAGLLPPLAAPNLWQKWFSYVLEGFSSMQILVTAHWSALLMNIAKAWFKHINSLMSQFWKSLLNVS